MHADLASCPPPPPSALESRPTRSYAIQQEFCKAHQLCTLHPSEYAEDCEYPILMRLFKTLP